MRVDAVVEVVVVGDAVEAVLVAAAAADTAGSGVEPAVSVDGSWNAIGADVCDPMAVVNSSSVSLPAAAVADEAAPGRRGVRPNPLRNRKCVSK